MEVKVNIIDTLFTTIPKNTVVASYTIDEDSVDLTMLNDQYSFNTTNKTILTSSNVTSNNLKAINFTARNWVSGEQVEINDMYPRVVSKLQNKFNKPNTIVYSTESAVTTFTYTMLFATALESVYRVLEVNIDTVELTASGTHYQRYSSTQPITSFDMSKSTSTGKVFDGTQNIIAMGTDSENIRIPSSAYPRIFAILVEIDDRAIFSTKLELYSAKGSYIDYSTNTVMNYIGVSTTNSKVSAALSACNIHN